MANETKSVITQEYMHAICELLTEKNQLLTHGRISAIDHNRIEIVQRNEEEDLALSYPFGMPVKLNVFHARFGLKVLTGIIYGSDGHSVVVAGAEVLQASDRRDFVRVPSSHNGALYPLSQLPDLPAVALTGENVLPIALMSLQIKIRVENISLSGIQFSCFEKLNRNEKYLVIYAPISQRIHLQCTIVRSFKDELDRFHYGCRLLELRGDELDELSKLVLRLQLLQRGRKYYE